jgi:predicted AAA+ superfamily ATPase
VTSCLDALRALYVIDLVEPWTANLTKRTTGRSKAIVADSGLAAHLAGIEADWPRQQVGGNALGPLLEGFVMAELIKQRAWSSSRWSLALFRDRDGLEVDAVMQFADGRLILLEVKAAQTYRSEHFAAMKKLGDLLGDRLVAGVVLSMADHTFQYGEKL